MKGIISWFASNGVASNLLMLFIIISGLITLTTIKEELFPEIQPAIINVTTIYPGESPDSVEEGITVKVEEAVYGIEGIKRVTSRSTESVSVVSIEIEEDIDRRGVLEDIKTKVEAIDTFPDDAERPIVEDVEIPSQVLSIAVWGQTDDETLQQLAEQVRDDLTRLRAVSKVEIANKQKYEIVVEVSEDELQRYGLSFDQISMALQAASVDISGGSVKSETGELVLRTKTRAYTRSEFEMVPVLTRPDGTSILIRDVATVRDGFEENTQASYFNGEPVKLINVFAVGEQSLPKVVEAVKSYLADAPSRMPEGVKLSVWRDWSKMYSDRMDLMQRTGTIGLILVFIVLALFLKFRLAVWTAIGIPTALLGAIWLMPMMDVTLNMMTLFAFIVALGIVVDDAIVVSENIHFHNERGQSGVVAARRGAIEVMKPVILAVLTTVAAFLPMMTMPGVYGAFGRVVPVIVVACLAFSLVESLLVLPSHLSHAKPISEQRRAWGPFGLWQDFQNKFAQGLQWVIEKTYRPVLNWCLRWRYLTLAGCLAILMLVFGMVGAQFIKFEFFPPIEGDNVIASLTMPPGTPVEVTQEAVKRLEKAAMQVREEFEGDKSGTIFKNILSSIGTQPESAAQAWITGNSAEFSAEHLGEVNIELMPSETRSVSSTDIKNRWRELVGSIPDALELSFGSSITHTGKPIEVDLMHKDPAVLRAAADDLKARLSEFTGVHDISDSMRSGKRQLNHPVNELGRALGLTNAEVGYQVRQAFYGDEAQRIQRGRDDVKVKVRYPLEDRKSLASLHDLRVRRADGAEIPLSTVADVSYGRDDSAIERAGRTRSVTVTADLDTSKANANEIIAALEAGYFPHLVKEHHGLSYSFEGEQKNQAESMGGLQRGAVIAMFLIFSILAIAFRSFVQPLVVMFAIPFGFAGALVAHWGLGLNVTLLSSIGMLAMSGVVVNDSMIMIDFINRYREEGHSIFEAVKEAGPRRFRPILITSLTTFAGLTPMLLERSVQAQFLIPMAVSLAFGVLLATVITLIIVPTAYIVLYDNVAKLLGLTRNLFSVKVKVPS